MTTLQKELDILTQEIARQRAIIEEYKKSGQAQNELLEIYKVRNKELCDALQSLLDEQNYAPLERRRKQWQEACITAARLLSKMEDL